MSAGGGRAWLLHRRPYRESSALVDLLVAGQGRIRAVARGVHGHKSRLAQTLQPFSPLHIELGGRGELANLIRAESDGPPLLLAGEPLLCAFYLNELLVRLLPFAEGCDPLLTAYEWALRQLLAEPAAIERPLRLFELALLRQLGMEIDWPTDGYGEPVVATAHYGFVPTEGWLAGGRAGQQVTGAALLAMATPEDPGWLAAARLCLRVMLDALLGDKPLQSRALMRQQRQRSRR